MLKRAWEPPARAPAGHLVSSSQTSSATQDIMPCQDRVARKEEEYTLGATHTPTVATYPKERWQTRSSPVESTPTNPATKEFILGKRGCRHGSTTHTSDCPAGRLELVMTTHRTPLACNASMAATAEALSVIATSDKTLVITKPTPSATRSHGKGHTSLQDKSTHLLALKLVRR
jgi:hypothetical protein